MLAIQVHHQKRKKVASTKSKSSHGSSHPKYSDMIKSALKALNDRGGSSRAAILKFVLANYSLDPTQANQHLKLALKNGVKAKYFKQTKGNGASGSFKLAVTGEGKPTKKKSTKPKKATSSNTSPTKKRSRSKSAGTKSAKKVATTAAVDTNTSTVAAATNPTAAKPKNVRLVKPKTSATAKSANAVKPKKTTQTKTKKSTGAKTAGAKKATTAKKTCSTKS